MHNHFGLHLHGLELDERGADRVLQNLRKFQKRLHLWGQVYMFWTEDFCCLLDINKKNNYEDNIRRNFASFYYSQTQKQTTEN